MAILIHPDLTMRKYHDGGGEPAYGWTAACVRDELARRFLGLPVALPEGSPSPDELGQATVRLAGRVPAELLGRMPELAWIQFPGSGADHFFKASGLGPEAFRGARGARSELARQRRRLKGRSAEIPT